MGQCEVTNCGTGTDMPDYGVLNVYSYPQENRALKATYLYIMQAYQPSRSLALRDWEEVCQSLSPRFLPQGSVDLQHAGRSILAFELSLSSKDGTP